MSERVEAKGFRAPGGECSEPTWRAEPKRASGAIMNTRVIALMVAAAFVGCATTGTPVSKAGGDDEEAAAKNETAPKPPSDDKIQAAKQEQAAAKKQPAAAAPKISASVKAEFDGAVKKWETAKASKTGINPADCKGLAANFSRISDGQLAAQARFNAGTILEGCGYEKDAEGEYQAALSANPAYAPAMANLGQIYWKQNNPSTAKSWFEKAIQADPAHAGAAYANLGAIIYNQGKQSGDKALYTEAIRNLRRALAIDAYDVSAYSILALVYYTIAENDKSKLDLAALVCKQARDEVDKTYPPIYNTLGLIELRKKNPSSALKQFEKAVELDPKYIEAHLNIGAIGLSTRQYEKAAQSFAAVLKLDAKNFDATIGMGVASRGLKKIEDAEGWYKKASDLDPRNCAVQYNMGVLYQDYKSDPANANLNQAKDFFSKYRSCGNADTKKVADAERRMKDIDEVFAAIESQKKMEAELKVQQDEMEKQQKAMEEQQKAQEAATKKDGAAPAAGAEKPAGGAAAPDADKAEKPKK
jgi:tetratricopeptide (TPR) repeat protein